MANVAFIYTIRDLAAIRHKNLKLFPLTNAVKSYLIANKIIYENFEDYFPKKLSGELNSLAGSWATSKTSPGVGFPDNLSLSLHNYFAKKLFQLAAIDNLMKIEQPDEVFLEKKEVPFKNLFTSDFEDIAEIIKLVCAKHKVKLICEWTGDFWPLKYLIQFLLPPRFRKVIEGGDFDYKVLLAAHHYHAINIFPLLSFLQKSRLKPLLVGRIGAAKRILDKNKINYIEFNREIPFKNLPDFLLTRLKFLLDLIKFLRSKKTFSYCGYNLWPIFKPKLISLFLSDALNLYTHKIFYSKLLSQVQPSLVVAVTNDSSNQTLITTAKRMGIPTLEIQHGITAGFDGGYLQSDKFAVWGKIPKDIYAKNGVGLEKMIICGWPGYESYLNRRYIASKINSKNVSIAFLAQAPEGMSLLFMSKTPEENLEIFFKSISMLGFKTKVSIRLHPRADKSIPFTIAEKYGVKFRLSENETLGELLSKTDIVVGQTTSATLDAIIMHKPVIYLPSMNWPAKFVEGSEAVFEANDTKSLTRAIDEIIDKGISPKMITAQKRFIENYCNFSKNSLVEITKVIRSMSKQ